MVARQVMRNDNIKFAYDRAESDILRLSGSNYSK